MIGVVSIGIPLHGAARTIRRRATSPESSPGSAASSRRRASPWSGARRRSCRSTTRKRREVVLSATGAGSTGSLYPNVMNEVLKTRFKLVQGYKGTHEAMLALERGEAEGHSTTWDAVKSVNMRWVKEGTDPHPGPARPQPRARPAERADLGRACDDARGPRGDARDHGHRRDRQVLFHHAGGAARPRRGAAARLRRHDPRRGLRRGREEGARRRRADDRRADAGADRRARHASRRR